VTALLLGVVTALMWTNSNLCSALAVRSISQQSAVAWITLVGLLITAPFSLAAGVPPGLTVRRIAALAVVGLAVAFGLVLLYGAYRIGKVAVVAPISATEGAIAADNPFRTNSPYGLH
jgi:uncharacterized membrane protein